MAMALAFMNPMVGSNTPQIGGMMIDVDKDLKNDGWSRYYVTRGFDSKSFIGIDNNGKVNTKKNNLLSEQLSSSIYYLRADNVDEVFDNLLEELKLPYQERPVHALNYIYEAFTGNRLYTSDQLEYDVLLEKIYLDKLSKSLSADATNLKNEFNREKNKKDIHYPLEEKPNYTQDWDQPDAGVKLPLLAAANIVERELNSLLENREVEEVE